MGALLACMTLQAQPLSSVSRHVVNTQPDAEYLLLRQKYVINNDGTTDINYRKELKLYRNRAFTAYADKGETFIVYNPAYETLTINEAYTIMADGKLVAAPKNAFIDQLPHEAIHCGRYNNLREMVVVHTALEYNATIVLDYTIHRNNNLVEEEILLAQDCPVKRYELEVVSATAAKINYQTANFEQYGVKIECTNEADNKLQQSVQPGKMPITMHSTSRLRVVAENLPQVYNDAYLPQACDLYPMVAFSSIPINGKPLGLKYQASTIPMAENLLANLDNDDKVKQAVAIRDWVMDNINLNNLPLDKCGYTATDSITLTAMCGTVLDRAFLMASLMTQSGIPAYATFNPSQGNHLMYLYKLAEPEVRFSIGMEEFSLSAVRKDTSQPSNVITDKAEKQLNIKKTLPYNATSLVDGSFVRILLPNEPGACSLNPALLTSVRTAPLLIPYADETVEYHIECPAKMVVVGNNNYKYNIPGIGAMSVTVRQKQDLLIVTRKLQLQPQVLNPVQSSVEYAKVRQMMADWVMSKTIILQHK